MVMKVLDHENIIKFHESFETFDYIIYVIELVKGVDLFKHVTDQEFLEEVEVSFILRKILEALGYIHAVGLIHRDLKPENIMIILDETKGRQAGNIKIIDFGFSAYLEDLSQNMNACGTLNYVAPEIYQTQKYSFVSDVFAVGVILYFMIRGELPFNSDVQDILIGNICNGNYNMDEDDHFYNVSPDCKDLIRRMLETDPKKRASVLECLAHPFVQNPQKLVAFKGKNKQNFDFNGIGQFHA